MTRRRLDAELVRRGLVASRTEAADAVRAGTVMVEGALASKPASMVAEEDAISVAAPSRRFVSRGGEKLAAALERFDVRPTGRVCLDAGASTGGFTDCLLAGGATRVIAVDVGYGQLAWGLRNDTRVTVLERTNVRDLTAAHLPSVPDLVVADLSFISLRLVLPSLLSICAADAEFVLLVKPQFEAGPGDVGRGGVVRDPDVWRRILLEVTDAMVAQGLGIRGVMASPLRGPAGNVEFFVHARRGEPTVPPDVGGALAEVPV